MPRQASCQCGVCKKCKQRIAAKKKYDSLSMDERRAIISRRDPEKERAKERRRYDRDKTKRLAAQAAYVATPRGKARSAAARVAWMARNPEKRKAQVAVGNAIRDGRLMKGECEQTGGDCRGRITAHHDDYSKPLEVRWLCVFHHRAVHLGST